MTNHNFKQFFGIKKLLVIFFVLYFATIAFRLYDIGNDDYQPDEYHWIDRSRGIVDRFQKGELSELTSHLDHPGIPPAVLMALSEITIKKYNSFFGYRAHDDGYIDELTAARSVIALVSSLAVPIIFFFLLPWFGIRTALLTSILFAFDPIYIGLSREAHLDSILTLFVVIATFLFVSAELNNKTSTKLVAGFFWGLAMATKVSAIGFLMALVSYRFLTMAIWFGSKKRVNCSLRAKPVLLMWSDLGAVLVGHLTLVSIYTRLWSQQHRYSVLKRVQSHLADSSYEFASWLRYSDSLPAKLVVLIAMICFVVGIFYAIKARRNCMSNSRIVFSSAILLTCASALCLIQFFIPSLIENFVRLYMRIFCLKDIPHVAYGREKAPVPYGYLFIIFNRLTVVALVGLVLAVVLLFKEKWRKFLCPDHERAKMLFLMLVIAIVWIIILGVSPKKTIRYIMPVVPVIYLISALGWQAVLSILGNFYSRQAGGISQSNIKFINFSCCSLVIIQLGIALSYAPKFITHYSPFFGGFKGGATRNMAQPILGQEEIIRFLDSQPRGDFVVRTVKVIGDHEMLQATAARLSRPNAMPIRFRPQNGLIEGYYLVVYWSFFKDIDPGYLHKIITTPFSEGRRVFDYNYQGVNIATIFSFPMSSLEKPLYFEFEEMMQATGEKEFYRGTKPSQVESGTKVVTVKPERDKKGYVALNYDIVVRAGEFKFGVLMGIPADVQLDSILTPDRYAIRFEFTKDCAKIVTLGELNQNKLNWIEFNCRAE